MPLIFLSPLFLISLFDLCDRKNLSWIPSTFLAMNFLFLPFATFTPAYGPVKIYQAIDQVRALDQDVLVFAGGYYQKEDRPLSLELHFYNSTHWKQKVVADMAELKQLTADSEQFLVTSTLQQYFHVRDEKVCNEISSVYPAWTYNYNWFHWADRSAIWVFWRCSN